MKPRIAMVGKGNVGSALARGLQRAGYEVLVVGNDPTRVREMAVWGEVIVLAVPYTTVDQVVRELGDAANGKVLVDVLNPLTADFQLAVGFTTSSAEELQRKVPAARVVKAFNTVFAQQMDSGHAHEMSVTTFVAGDDQAARSQALSLARDLGFDAVDSGPLKNSRWLEAMGYFIIQLGYMLQMGPGIGFKLLH